MKIPRFRYTYYCRHCGFSFSSYDKTAVYDVKRSHKGDGCLVQQLCRSDGAVVYCRQELKRG